MRLFHKTWPTSSPIRSHPRKPGTLRKWCDTKMKNIETTLLINQHLGNVHFHSLIWMWLTLKVSLSKIVLLPLQTNVILGRYLWTIFWIRIYLVFAVFDSVWPPRDSIRDCDRRPGGYLQLMTFLRDVPGNQNRNFLNKSFGIKCRYSKCLYN